MNPEAIKAAQAAMVKMSPAQIAEMQRAAASLPPSVLKAQAEAMKNMTPDQVRNRKKEVFLVRPSRRTKEGTALSLLCCPPPPSFSTLFPSPSLPLPTAHTHTHAHTHTRTQTNTIKQIKQATEMMANARPEDLSRQVRAAASATADRARYVLSASTQLKDEGNSLFKMGKHAEALAKYERAIYNVSSSEVTSEVALHAEAKALRKACLLNSAAAALGAESWARAIEAASAALAEEPGNAKALFRRGLARAGEARKKEGGENGKGSETLAAAAADLRAAAAAARGTADEATIREKLAEVEENLKDSSAPASASSAAEAAVEAAAARVKAEDDARRAEREKKEAEEGKAAAAAASAASPFSAAGAGGSLSGGTPDPSQLRAMAQAMRADPSLGEKMSTAAKAMTPEQLRAAAASQGLPAEAQATLSPDALSAAGSAMAAMKPEDLERMADAVEAAGKASGAAGGSGSGSSSSPAVAAASSFFGGGAGSSPVDPSNPAAAAAAMLKDPAALRQATAMVKGMRPEQLAALSGGKIDVAQAEKLVKTLDGMSDEYIRAMLATSAKFADWIRRGKEAKEKYLTRPVMVALVVVLLAVLLKRAGWF